MSKQRILCTGSCGFIFSNFVRKLTYENKYNVVSIDKITRPSLLNNIYINKNHTLHIGDVADEHFINLIFEYERPDIVVHGAAESNVDISIKDPNRFIHSNVLGTQVMVNAAIKWGVKKFIQVSTDELGGQLKENDPLWTEDVPLNPRNPYAASKASAELIVKAASSTFGLDYCITRSCNNFGPWQTTDKFIPRIIKSIVNKEKIPVYGQGLQMRDWIHVFDNCSAILKVIESGKPGEIYNISANQEFRNIEIVQRICKAMNVNLEDSINYVPDRLGHDYRYGIDATKLKNLGWSPTIKFNDGLKMTIDWYLANRYFLKT